MGLIVRHAGAPFATSETLASADLEADISVAFAEVNGLLDNANLKSGANVNGSKLLNSSVTAAKVAATTLTTAKMAASAVPKHYVDTLSAESWTASTSLADVAGITAATLTPGSTNDMIFMDFTATVDPSAVGNLIMGWHINGTDYDDITSMFIEAANGEQIFTSSYAIAAPAATSMTIKPRHKISSTAAADLDTGIFRCWILPGK